MGCVSAQISETEPTIVRLVRELVERREVADVKITLQSKLQEDLGFDSLELAELSAALEEELGSDPYSEGLTPQTIGELLAFYPG
jgi:acyl carrier protein